MPEAWSSYTQRALDPFIHGQGTSGRNIQCSTAGASNYREPHRVWLNMGALAIADAGELLPAIGQPSCPDRLGLVRISLMVSCLCMAL